MLIGMLTSQNSQVLSSVEVEANRKRLGISARQSGTTFLRKVIPFHLSCLSMIFPENRSPLFRIML
jgi:hypothetical protein